MWDGGPSWAPNDVGVVGEGSMGEWGKGIGCGGGGGGGGSDRRECRDNGEGDCRDVGEVAGDVLELGTGWVEVNDNGGWCATRTGGGGGGRGA